MATLYEVISSLCITAFFTRTITNVGAAPILPIIMLILLYYCRKQHPLNYILLSMFTLSVSILTGSTCKLINGNVIFNAWISTVMSCICLTLCTFWAGNRGCDFNFLRPFLFCGILVLMVLGMIKLVTVTYGCLAAIIFCGYIVHKTDYFIKRCPYDEHIWAANSVFVDAVNLFLALLTIFKALDA